MNDTHEGSEAARRAQPDPDESASRGFFGRIMGALGGADPAPEPAGRAQAPNPQSPAQSLPGLANLRRLRVEDVAMPEAEIVAVPIDIEPDALLKVFRDSGFSRLPVYRETLDQPLGLLLLKDLALEYGFNGGLHAFDLKPLLRPLLYVPPSMPLVVLLQKMQTQRIHMALVIDEYGGVAGLVTIEDLIEEVVGEIEDEHDTEEEGLWTREAPGVWLAQARSPLEEIEAEIGISLTGGLDDDDVDTLGGLIFLLAGRVPARGEVIAHPNGAEIEVVDADPRRVKRVRLRLLGRSGGSGPAPAGAGAPQPEADPGPGPEGLPDVEEKSRDGAGQAAEPDAPRASALTGARPDTRSGG